MASDGSNCTTGARGLPLRAAVVCLLVAWGSLAQVPTDEPSPPVPQQPEAASVDEVQPPTDSTEPAPAASAPLPVLPVLRADPVLLPKNPAPPPVAGSEDNWRLQWNPAWPMFRTWEYVATTMAGTASVGAFVLLSAPNEADWHGGILFDDAARKALRIRSASGADQIRKASDYTAIAATLLAVSVDSVLIPIVRKNSAIAVQLLLMDAEAFAYSTLLTTLTFREAGRTRPSYDDCQRDPHFDRLCNSGPFSSFPSGHANSSATAAGLSCAHHLHLNLYGNKVADALACGVSSALAVSTSLFRVMGDRHYVSDVIAGQVIGFGFGYGVPTFLHYASGGHEPTSAAWTIAPLAGSQYGLQAIGAF